MKITTNKVLSIMKVIFWIAFIGLLIETGAMLVSYILSLVSSGTARDFYKGLDLSELKAFGLGHYTVIVLFLTLLSGLKAYLSYLVISIFSRINFIHPFSREIAGLISRISYVALGAGVLGMVANAYSDMLGTKGLNMQSLQQNWERSAEFIFLSGIIFLISRIFIRGIELQSENDLTI